MADPMKQAAARQDLIARVSDEADQCRNDGADDIARLLDEVAAALSHPEPEPEPEARGDEPELTSREVNDACWAFAHAMPHSLPGPIWNDLKPAVHAAICEYLKLTRAAPAAPQAGGDIPLKMALEALTAMRERAEAAEAKLASQPMSREGVRLSDPEMKPVMDELKRRMLNEPGFALFLLQRAGIANPDGSLAEEFGGIGSGANHG